ncbi:MAG: hypothetical protein IKB78_06105 [Clostridia bacterium]|nr:hypothetical protein [Clostridia bacterium]
MNDFLIWCDERTAACQQRRKELAADQRIDEARFEQIRANVYGVFRAVYAALQNNPAALGKKLREIPAAWEESLQLAQQHGDAEKAYIEQLKLDTAAEILREVPHD